MSDDEIAEARRAGEEAGRIKFSTENNTKRIDRLERGALALVIGAAYLWAQSKGLIP
jgi:hypothetical protein